MITIEIYQNKRSIVTLEYHTKAQHNNKAAVLHLKIDYMKVNANFLS
jgi:hypothetical protein